VAWHDGIEWSDVMVFDWVEDWRREVNRKTVAAAVARQDQWEKEQREKEQMNNLDIPPVPVAEQAEKDRLCYWYIRERLRLGSVADPQPDSEPATITYDVPASTPR